MCADFQGGADMWEDIDSHRYPTSASPQTGFAAPIVGGGVTASTPLGGEQAANLPSPSSPLETEEDFDLRLRSAVMRLRWQQPEEWDVYSRFAALDKQTADLLAVVEMQTECVLRLATKVDVLESKLRDLMPELQ